MRGGGRMRACVCARARRVRADAWTPGLTGLQRAGALPEAPLPPMLAHAKDMRARCAMHKGVPLLDLTALSLGCIPKRMRKQHSTIMVDVTHISYFHCPGKPHISIFHISYISTSQKPVFPPLDPNFHISKFPGSLLPSKYYIPESQISWWPADVMRDGLGFTHLHPRSASSSKAQRECGAPPTPPSTKC